MPLYTDRNQVKVRLIGKVRFTDDLEDQNKMPELLLTRLIDEAEAQVEVDLAPRYKAPFQTKEGQAFSCLPTRPTKEFLRTMCELKSVIRVLETDFGRGTAIEGKKYKEDLENRYKTMKETILARRDEMGNQWKNPPLPCLKLNDHNTEADDGFMGMVLSTSDNIGDYPSKQINSPGENYWFIQDRDVTN
jgi:hypothetical protein